MKDEYWGNGYKSLALFGGALIIACSFYKDEANTTPKFMTNVSLRKSLVMIGCLLLGGFFISSKPALSLRQRFQVMTSQSGDF